MIAIRTATTSVIAAEISSPCCLPEALVRGSQEHAVGQY